MMMPHYCFDANETKNDINLFKKNNVIIGGTFDALHIGHKEYIKFAFQSASKVFIMLTDDNYASGKKSYKVKSCEERNYKLVDFIKEQKFSIEYYINKIKSDNEIIDFCLTHKINMGITSPEYRTLIKKINLIKLQQKLSPLTIKIKQRAKTIAGFDINSTHINLLRKKSRF